MSNLPTHAIPSTTATDTNQNASTTEIEPDEEWKAHLKAKIEEGLTSMVQDAKDNLEKQLRQSVVSPEERERLSQEYTEAMINIRKLAADTFQDELNRERQERRWATGLAMNPQWAGALKQEQQDIMDRIKQTGGQIERTSSKKAENLIEERREERRPMVALPFPDVYDPPPLPPQIKEERERAAALKNKNARRGSDAHATVSRDRDEYVNSLRRQPFPSAHERPSVPEPWSGKEQSEETEDLLRHPRSRQSEKAHAQEPPWPSDRPPRSERHAAHSPPKIIPEIWKPSISPEEDAAASKPYVLARRDSSASMRSIGSTGIRAPVVDSIPERPRNGNDISRNAERERERERQHEAEKSWNSLERARERERGNQNRYENRHVSSSDQNNRPDDTPSAKSRSVSASTVPYPPPAPPLRPVVTKTSFTNDERYYQAEKGNVSRGLAALSESRDQVSPSIPKSLAPKPSHAVDDRDHHGLSHRPSLVNRMVPTKGSFVPDDRDRLTESPSLSRRDTTSNPRRRMEERDIYPDDRIEGRYADANPLTPTRPVANSSSRSREHYAGAAEDQPDRIPREHSTRHMGDPTDGHYKSSGSNRPIPTRQPSFPSPLSMDEFERRQGGIDDPHSLAYMHATASIPIMVPRESPSVDESEIGSWRSWGHDARRRDPHHEQHSVRSPLLGEIMPRWQGPQPSPSSYQGVRHEVHGYHSFGGRDNREPYDVEFDESFDSREVRREGRYERESEIKHREEAARLKEEEVRRIVEEELKKKLDEATKQQAETRIKEIVELQRRENEAERKTEEARRITEEARQRKEEAELEETEAGKKRQEVALLEEKARKKEEEAARKQDEAKRREDEARKRERESLKREEEARKKEEEIRRLEEQTQQKAEEIQRRERSLDRREKDFKRREAEAKQKEEEKRLEEQERRLEEEQRQAIQNEWRRLEQERLKREQDKRQEEKRQEEKRQEEEKIRYQQQEEFRRREEDINRRRADERKRQDSFGAEGAWATPSSSPGTSKSNFSSQDKPSTGSNSTWNNAGSAWTSTPKATSTASSAANVHRTTTTPTTKPRAGSTSAGANTANPPPQSSTPSTEAEWARRQQEQAKKQQDAFRREQERLEAERLARAAKVMSKEDVILLFETHERLWSRLATLDELGWYDFPWPVFKKPSTPEEITLGAVSAYILSPHYPEKDKSRPQKDRLKEQIRRWHPDRFETKLLTKVVESDKDKVKEGAGTVVRSLNDLLTRSNAPSLFS